MMSSESLALQSVEDLLELLDDEERNKAEGKENVGNMARMMMMHEQYSEQEKFWYRVIGLHL